MQKAPALWHNAAHDIAQYESCRNMDCPHCGKAFHDNWKILGLGFAQWHAHVVFCPACKCPILELELSPGGHNRFRVYPTNTFRKPTPNEVPPHIKEDYEEACRVLPISPKASATLSRRCLQVLLREQGYTQRNLVDQITALLGETDPKKTAYARATGASKCCVQNENRRIKSSPSRCAE